MRYPEEAEGVAGVPPVRLFKQLLKTLYYYSFKKSLQGFIYKIYFIISDVHRDNKKWENDMSAIFYAFEIVSPVALEHHLIQ